VGAVLAETEPDPNRYVERWLDANTYKASEGYSGTVRVAVYAVPTVMSNQPITRSTFSLAMPFD